MLKKISAGLLIALMALATGRVSAAEALTPDVIAEVVTGAAEVLEAQYIFPDVGKDVADSLIANLEAGAFDGVSEPGALATLLTTHMRDITKDLHLSLLYSEFPFRTEEEFDNASPEERANDEAVHRYYNAGIRRVGRLDGNIGYLELTGFMEEEFTRQPLGIAMDLLQHTGGLIIDLRENSGGMPETVALLASYFLGPESIHVDSIYWKRTDTTQEYWTTTDLDGTWYGTERPVLLLTSTSTFSAAEAFSYAMKAFGRAEVVGETTRGGAHPTGIQRVTDNFALAVPNSRAFSAVTNENWEGTGISPNYPASADTALVEAQKVMLRKLIAGEGSVAARQDREMYLRELEGVGE